MEGVSNAASHVVDAVIGNAKKRQLDAFTSE
jgi:hypothetical protein